jgi:serine phosphatase RsbU (regulator of sigma subunit)
MGYYDDANEYLNEALSISTKQNNSKLILDCYQMLSTNYYAIGNIKKAKEYSNKAESFQNYIQEQSIKQDFSEQIIETKQEVVKTEREKKLAKKLFEIQQELNKRKQDSLQITIRSKQDSLFEAARIARAKQIEVENLQNKQRVQELTIKQQEAKAQNQRLIILMITGGFILMIVLAFVMLRANRQRKKANIKLAKQNKEIEEKSAQLSNALKKIAHQNQNITQSINYAKGIQQAMLPKPEQFKNLFTDNFILFKPRDIVSGDFYYFKEVDAKSDIFKIFGMHRIDNKNNNEQEKKKEKKLIISAVDCTVHRVPGAFMSMIGYNLLDDITFKGITRPDLILEEMHRGVRTALKQKETNNQDGMDMAICVIDVKKKTMEFAGAKNPIIYIQDNEITQIKGDKDGIGGKSDDHKFKYHTIDVNKPTWVYLFSDGYIDQFGGIQGRKFMIKRFRELLFEIYTKPMSEQKEFLDKTFIEWIGKDYNQIDDVLVMGFKLDLS